jgi:RHS repeat-associated protein
MEKGRIRCFFQVVKFRLLALSILICLLLIVIVPKNAFGEDAEGTDGTVETGTSSGVGATALFLMKREANAKATQKTEEDPRKRQQKDEYVDATGAFQYQYPLNLPEGTNNLAPELTLAYNSNVDNGIMGTGWFIKGISEIQRDFNYEVNYNANDHFIYNGDKLIKTPDGYYHMQRENFERIEYNSSQNYWVVTQKDGTKYYYGYQGTEHSANTCGRILVAGDSSKTLLWSLSKVLDIRGNYYIIEYNQDTTNGDYYPVKITYTKNERKPLQAVRTIEFSYELRNDHYVMYSPTKQDMDHRLKWVTAKMNGSLLRKWRLDYEYGASTGRSRLTTIQEYGSDGNAPDGWECGSFVGTGKVLPKIGFEWREGESGFTTPVESNWPSYGENYYPGDFNGDGKTDFIITPRDSSIAWTGWKLYLSTGNGFEMANSGNWPTYGERFYLGDFNGDGKTDFIITPRDSSIAWTGWKLYLSTGKGFELTSSGDWPTYGENFYIGDFNGDGKSDFMITPCGSGVTWSGWRLYLSNGKDFEQVNISNWPSYEERYYLGDFNGDGKTDFIVTPRDSSIAWTGWKLYLSTGKGFELTSSGDWPTYGENFYIGDFNGDGKSDFMITPCGSWVTWSGWRLYLSNGKDFEQVNVSNWPSYGERYYLGDFNGDGKTDFIIVPRDSSIAWTGWKLYLSTGKGFELTSSGDWPTYGENFHIGDFNGDGKSDFMITPCGSWVTWSGCKTYYSKGYKSDILVKIKNNNINLLDVNYTPAPQLPGAVDPGGKTYPNIANCGPAPLVTQITFEDGLGEGAGHAITNTYSYSNGMIRTGLPHERANLGFAWIERKNNLTGTVRTYYRQDDFDLRLMADKEEVYGTDGKLYTEKSYVYQKRPNSNNPDIVFIYPEQEILKNYNGEDGAPVTYQVGYGFDAFGNPMSINDSGDISVTGDETRTERNFNQYLDSATYLFLPEYEKKYGIKLNGQEGLAAETRFYYNTNHTLEHMEQENEAQDVATRFGYDDYGNVTSMTDGNGNTTTCTYDDKYQTFLRLQTLKFTEETIYDNLMRPIKKKDANGQTWETTYDVFSREKSRVSPGDTITSPTTKITYPDEFVDTNGNPIFPQCKKTEKKIADGNCIEVYTYTDGLDRVIQEKTESRNGWITVDHIYDGAGREAQTSMPYFKTSSSYTAPSSDVKYTTLTFDPIGRLAKTELPDQTKICQYYGKQETLTVDPLGHVTNKRIVGNIEENINYTGVYPNQVEYSKTATVNACDGMKKADAFGKEFITTIDMLGRTTKSVTPVNGTWSYSFDANHNLKTQTDAKNQKIALDYDSLNRLTKKSYPDGSSVNYYYDETGHGYANGLLTRVEYPGGSESYTYDTRGRKTEVTQTIGGIGKTKKFTYNSLDQVVTQTLPDGEVVTNSYDTGGMLSGLKGSSTYLTDVNYYASAKISKMAYGNGVQTDYDYYDNAGENDPSAGINFSYRLKQIRVYKTSDLLNLTYEYDKSDNVKVKRDSINAKYTETYGYDDLSRLISANSTSYGSKTFQYDKINNITLKDNRTYQYDTVNPYKLVNDGQYSYTYDANGSMINRNDGRVIGWDYENRVKSISGGSGYEYNAGGQRIKKVEGDITKLYFFADYEEEYKAGVKTKTVKYYFAYKLRVAENSTTTGVRYYHKDHLSSSTVITDTNGSLVRRIIYAPYGSESASEGTAEVSYKYTDKEKDTTGLYYFGARFYDPEVGRFLTVDPKKDGENWYAYCYNNPINNTDPDGLQVYVGRTQVISLFGITAYHTFTLITDTDIKHASVGKSYVYEAGPSNKFSLGTSFYGTLEMQQYNTPKAVLSNPEKYHLEEIPTPEKYDNWQGFADALTNHFDSYANIEHPGYTPYPTELDSNWANCNSFTGSAFRASGSSWEPDYYVPGWDTNINFGDYYSDYDYSDYDYSDYDYSYCDYSSDYDY